jgi:hypothetical protein
LKTMTSEPPSLPTSHGSCSTSTGRLSMCLLTKQTCSPRSSPIPKPSMPAAKRWTTWSARSRQRHRRLAHQPATPVVAKNLLTQIHPPDRSPAHRQIDLDAVKDGSATTDRRAA